MTVLEAYKVMMLDVTENKYFNVYTSIVSMIQFLYSHNFNVIYDTCIRGSHIMMLIKFFLKLVLPTDRQAICAPFIKGDNTSYIARETALFFLRSP